MPVGAQGAAFRLRTKQETAEGTAETGNYDQVPCLAFGLTPQQDMQQDAVLSSGSTRDQADPIYGLVQVSGEARVPIETVHIGRWLKMLMGAPTTTNVSTDYTHIFKSGSSALPSNSFEKAFPDITRFEMAVGVRANTMAVQIAPDGSAEATIGLMGLAETNGNTTGAGTPVVTAYERFHRVNGAVARGGSPLAAVTGGDLTITNDMEMVAAIRNDFRMEGIDFGQSGAAGNLTLRFLSHTLRADALGRTPADLRYTLTISATKEIEFRFPRAFLAVNGAPIEGPRGISQSFRFAAAYDTSQACAVQVTLKNQVAAY
jgi:hypothetical protein